MCPNTSADAAPKVSKCIYIRLGWPTRNDGLERAVIHWPVSPQRLPAAPSASLDQRQHNAPNYYMMSIMRNSTNARTAAKEASHERIVQAAARAIRRSGYDGTAVADIMKEAGLTHGAFYAHFDSREAMLAEAASQACAESVAAVAEVVSSVPAGKSMEAMLRAYLSKEHLENTEVGCPLAALGSETARQTTDVRRVTTRHIKEMVDLAARQSPDWGQPVAHERALVTVATMVGALLLARAVDDSALSDSLREAALQHLLTTSN